jgi:hypothetical protein
MTPDTAPEAITQALMAEMLALAPLQPAEPPKDRVFYARQHVPMKWTPYKPTSQEVKRGKKGRWQQRRAYGLGWENADEEPQAGAWIEDVINHPDRRLNSYSAGEGLAERIRAAVTYVYMPMQVRRLLSEAATALTPPSDAGSTTRSGGEGVPAGMKPWAGGDGPPADWNGGPVKLRCGDIEPASLLENEDWQVGYPENGFQPSQVDVVAYTPVATTPSPDASPDSGIGLRDQIARDAALFAALPAAEQSALRRELATVGCNPGIVFGPSPSPAIVKEAGEVERMREALEPWSNHNGPLPEYDSPFAGVFDSGVQYAVELLAKELKVDDWTPCDGTEEYDGDLGGTLMNIVRAAMPEDEHGEPMWPKEVRAALSASNAAQVSK